MFFDFLTVSIFILSTMRPYGLFDRVEIYVIDYLTADISTVDFNFVDLLILRQKIFLVSVARIEYWTAECNERTKLLHKPASHDSHNCSIRLEIL